jgi:hypothetical protein
MKLKFTAAYCKMRERVGEAAIGDQSQPGEMQFAADN